MPKPATTAKRVTASLRDPDLENLQEVSQATKLSENDSIRKALATEAFVQDVLRNGGKILIKDRDGTVREVAFVG